MEDMNTTALALQVAIGLLSLSGLVIGFLNTRANGGIRIKLAEIDARKTEATGDDKNVGTALTLTSAIVATFQPMGEILREIVVIAKENKTTLEHAGERFDAVAMTMQSVTTQRNDEFKAIVERLDAHQSAIEAITRQITSATDAITLREEVQKITLISSNMAADVKILVERTKRETGEHNAVEPEAKTDAPDVAHEPSEVK